MYCWTVANNLNSVRFDASLTQVAWTLTLRWRVLIGQYQVTWPYYTRKPHTRANRDTGSCPFALQHKKVSTNFVKADYRRLAWNSLAQNHHSNSVFYLGFFCRARRAPCPLLKSRNDTLPFWLKKKVFFFFKYQSHMAFSSVLPFLLPTHSVDCAVHLLLSHSRALLVSALFHPFTAPIMPFFFSSPR